MRLSNFVVLVGAGVLWGCAPAPTEVFVDYSKVPVAEGEELVRTDGVSLGGFSGAGVLAGSDPRRVGLEGESGMEGLARAREENRRRAFERLLESLEKQYLGRIEGDVSEAVGAIKEASVEDWGETKNRLRTTFEKYADRQGPVENELVLLESRIKVAGNRASRIFGAQTQKIEILEEDAAASRAILDALEAEYVGEISPVLAAFRVRQAARESAEVELRRDLEVQYRQEARDDAAQIVEASMRGFEELDVPRFKDLNAVAEERTGFEMRGARVGGLVSEGGVDSGGVWLKNEARLFAKSRGFVLVEKGKGGKDVTEEFIEWRKQYVVGR